MNSCSAGGCVTWWGWHPPLPPCHSRSRDCDGGLVMLGLRCAWLWYIKSITMGCQSRKSFLASGFERHYCGMPLHKFRHSGDEVGYWVHLRVIPYNQPQEKERIENRGISGGATATSLLAEEVETAAAPLRRGAAASCGRQPVRQFGAALGRCRECQLGHDAVVIGYGWIFGSGGLTWIDEKNNRETGWC